MPPRPSPISAAPEEYMKVMFTRHGRRAGVRVNTPSLHIAAVKARALGFAGSWQLFGI